MLKCNTATLHKVLLVLDERTLKRRTSTTAFGHSHTKALLAGRKMEIFKRYQTIEVSG